MLWRYDSGSPMLSVQTLETLVPGQRSTPTFFPGADGGLYHYKKDDGALEVLTSSQRSQCPLIQTVPIMYTSTCSSTESTGRSRQPS